MSDCSHSIAPRAPLRAAEGKAADGHRAHWTRERSGGSRVDLYKFIAYRCVIGSRAYGLEEPESDTDRRGFYVPPAAQHWSLDGVPEQLENPDTQEAYWEIQKFLTLALNANPNVRECLYSPIVEYASPIAAELLEMRHSFLSRRIYQTYHGYATAQFRRLEQDLRTAGSRRWKHAMHLVRLLIAGTVALREGYIPVRVGQHRDILLQIRRGEMAWEELDDWRRQLHREFESAFVRTSLSELPDYEAANALLIRARRQMVEVDPLR